MKAARVIAFYLPQFHPIPENDEWWGKDFTEWTNVRKAQPLFRGHHQPFVPTELGYYNLCDPQARAAQAKLARESGVEAFCYWHYWFGGKRLLERPFNEVVASGQPDFPLCLGWANQTWTGIWHGAPNKVLMEQTYPGRADHENHFNFLLPAFHDSRYLRVQCKPLFLIYRPLELPQPEEFIALWQSLAQKNGLPGIHFVAHGTPYDNCDLHTKGFDSVVSTEVFHALRRTCWERAERWQQTHGGGRVKTFAHALRLKLEKHLSPLLGSRPDVLEYEEALLWFLENASADARLHPCVVPNWDNSPRSGKRAVIFQNPKPELFRRHLRQALQLVAKRELENRLVFLKSWNEWAEGNYVEPDARFGRQYLDVLRDEILGPGNR